MASPQFEKLVGLIRAKGQPPLDHPLDELRAGIEGTSLPPGEDVTIAPVDVGRMPAEWIDAPGAATDRVVLYLHGGGYVMGSPPIAHRKLAGDISRSSGARVLLLDYRLAPEHVYPAAVDDGVSGYRWLLEQGIRPSAIALVGDSAGGGLTMATLLALRDGHDPLPAAAGCISPWVDFACDSRTMITHADRDPIARRDDLRRFGALYLGGADPHTSSPVHASLQGLPPLIIQVGDAEVLLDDSRLLAERVQAAGGDVTLEIWPEMVHVWHVFAGRVPESTAAVEKLGAFLRDHLGEGSSEVR